LSLGPLKDQQVLHRSRVAGSLQQPPSQEGRPAAGTPAHYHKLEVVEQGKHIHIHPDGTRHAHGGGTDVHGIYVAAITFQRPGPCGLEILARQGDGRVEAARLTITADEMPRAPAVGAAAPRSRNLIASDVTDLRQIDSSEPPDPRLHQTRIGEAIAQGKPQVIVFATPRYCTSRV